MISVELGIAIQEGDSGRWYTDYVELPDSYELVDDDYALEKAAVDRYFQQLGQQDNPPNVVHAWLYHYEQIAEDEDE